MRLSYSRLPAKVIERNIAQKVKEKIARSRMHLFYVDVLYALAPHPWIPPYRTYRYASGQAMIRPFTENTAAEAHDRLRGLQ
jgi:hypothetical protein